MNSSRFRINHGGCHSEGSLFKHKASASEQKDSFRMTLFFISTKIGKAFFLIYLLFHAAFSNTCFAQNITGKVYAAVLFNNSKSNVTGADRYVGVFARTSGETAWKNFSNTNLFAFGLGFSQHGAIQRHYIAGGNGLHRSADGGKTWKILTGWETMEILSVALDPVEANIIYIATPYGIFKSVDDGKTWTEKMRGCKSWYADEIIIDARDHHTLFAAFDDDLYCSRNGGENWSALKIGAPGIRTVFQPAVHPNVLLAGTEDRGVRVTFDHGKNWQAGAGIAATAIYAIHGAADGKTIYAGGYQTGVWQSHDLGKSWEQLWSAPEIEAIYSLFVDPANSNHLFVGTNGKGIYESTDGGKFWQAAGLSGAHVKQINSFP